MSNNTIYVDNYYMIKLGANYAPRLWFKIFLVFNIYDLKFIYGFTLSESFSYFKESIFRLHYKDQSVDNFKISNICLL
jgi:hypothetical protein